MAWQQQQMMANMAHLMQQFASHGGGGGRRGHRGRGNGGQGEWSEWSQPGNGSADGNPAKGFGKGNQQNRGESRQNTCKCTFCNKFGHLEAECRKKIGYDKAKTTVPLAPSVGDAAKQLAWGKSLAWVCISCQAEQWQDKANKCSACKHPRAQGEKTIEELQGNDKLKFKKVVEEALGNWSASDEAVPCPMTTLDSKAEEDYQREHKLLLAFQAHGGLEDNVASQKVKVAAAQKARPDPNRHLRDQGIIASGFQDLHNNYKKMKEAEDAKVAKLESKVKAMTEGLEERKKSAKEAYEATLAVLDTEFLTHSAHHAKELAQLQEQLKDLSEVYEAKRLECQTCLDKAAGAGRQGPETNRAEGQRQSVTPTTATITPADVTEDKLAAGMAAAGFAPEHIAGMSSFFLNFLNMNCKAPGSGPTTDGGVQAPATQPLSGITAGSAHDMDVELTDESEASDAEAARLNDGGSKTLTKKRVSKTEKAQKAAARKGGVKTK
jgi:hypothetical protein